MQNYVNFYLFNDTYMRIRLNVMMIAFEGSLKLTNCVCMHVSAPIR